MAADPMSPVLYVVACGGRPAGDLPNFIPRLRARGWDVCVVATPSALKFMDVLTLNELTGHVVRHTYKEPDEPDALPPADAIAVALPHSTPSTSGLTAAVPPWRSAF